MQECHHKAEQNRLETLEGGLKRFYRGHDRWPTNEAEFAWFVTGERPPTPGSPEAEERFRARYGLRKAPHSSISSLSANPLGITLKYLDDGALTIALNGEPDLVGTVAKPSR
jgi:hypothetical protein